MPQTILVVDDEEIVREVLGDMLRDAGYLVVEACHGAEALQRLDSHRVDLVLSDISMPVLDGYGLYQRIRAHPACADLPVMFLTAHGESPRVRHAKELGIDDYLVKPVGSEDLVVAVRALLARHARIAASQGAQIGQLKEAILRAVAHELRTPLTYVSGYAQLLAGADGAELERLRSLVDGILRGTRRLERLAQDLVFLVELRTGEAYRRFEGASRRLDHLPALLRAALEERRAHADAVAVALRAELPAELPTIVGEARLLGEAVDRLLDNAIKFSRKGDGEVTLRASSDADSVLIEVEDRGVGIPPAELSRIWELFHQVDRERNEQQGVGAGLTIARTIALMHRGELGARSEPGVGSTFTLRLPVAAP
jgi:signal transduction histidine kinase